MKGEFDSSAATQLPKELLGCLEEGSPVKKWAEQILIHSSEIDIKDKFWFFEESIIKIASALRGVKFGYSQEDLDICRGAEHPLAYFDLGINEFRNGNITGANQWLSSAAKLASKWFQERETRDCSRYSEHYIYQWAEKDLLPILSESRGFDSDDLSGEIEKVVVNARQVRFSGALDLWAEAASRKNIDREEEQIEQIEKAYQQKTRPLFEQIKALEEERDNLVSKVREPRLRNEQELTDLLERIIAIGDPPNYRRDREYTKDFSFGFEFSDVIELLKVALENDVDPVSLLRLCEYTRRDLEYHWEKHHGEVSRDNKETNLFDETTKDSFPELVRVEKEYNQGLNILFRCCLGSANDFENNFEEGRGHLSKAKEILDEIDTANTPELKFFFRNLSFFFELLASDKAKVFRSPVKEKYEYEHYSIKLK